MAGKAILRVAKVKTMGHIAGLGKHCERSREVATLNADPDLQYLNERLLGTGDWPADVQARLNLAPTIRKNAVLSIELMLTASPEWFNAGTQAEQDRRRDAWRDLSVQWVKEEFGVDNLVAAVLHRDESTPHIQALVVPIDERGRLNARHFLGGTRQRMVELQDSYAKKMEALGLERGVRGSIATHEEIKHWYAQVQGGRTVQVERQELNLDGHAEREQMSKAIMAHLRQVNLGTVLTHLGGTIDRDDPTRWRLQGDLVDIRGDQFRNLSRGQEGRGAIELVMHARPSYDFEDAVSFLANRAGPDIAVVAAARYAQNIAERAVARTPELPQRPAWQHERAREAAYER
jgi:Plasmid recombination enzyme